jgi:hypothetical protein
MLVVGGEKMNLLTKLNQWVVAPPPPTEKTYGGFGRNDGWNDLIFNQLENLRWMIEDKHWQDTINIQRDFINIGRLRHIPESYTRAVIDALMNDDDPPRVTRYIIRGS